MNATPLGKITVVIAGTPVPVTVALISASGGALPPSGGVARIEVWAVPGNTGTVFVKGPNGKIITALPAPAGGFAESWQADSGEDNALYPTTFSIDAANNNDGAYVTVWVS